MTEPIEQGDEEQPKPSDEGPMTERPPSEGTPAEEELAAPEPDPDPEQQADEADVGSIDPEATVNLTGFDVDQTVNLTGEGPKAPERDDATVASDVARGHLKGLLEALIFASDKPIKANELAKTAQAVTKQVKELLEELRADYTSRGIQLDEVAGGWIFRTNAAFAPFVRDLTKQKPVKLTRAQIETLSILAYRQPITRPEIDDIRGVDSGPVLKLLLDRDLVKILGKKDEPGRPLLYGTTAEFLEFFGLRSLKDLPTLREFTELTDESKRVVERELGETLESTAEVRGAVDDAAMSTHGDTLPPAAMEEEHGATQTEIPPAMGEDGLEADVTQPGMKPEPSEVDDASAEALSGDEAPSEPSGDQEPSEPSGDEEAVSEKDAPPALNADDEAEFPDDDDSDFDDDDDEDEDDEDEDEDDGEE